MNVHLKGPFFLTQALLPLMKPGASIVNLTSRRWRLHYLTRKGATMLDHVFLSVSDIDRSIAFYTAALVPLGIVNRHDYDGNNGPPGHPDLKGFGANNRTFFWLREGVVEGRAAHAGFVASSTAEVNAAYAAAIAAGAIDNGAPGARLYYAPRYYAANVLDPDGYSQEFVYKSWQHGGQ